MVVWREMMRSDETSPKNVGKMGRTRRRGKEEEIYTKCIEGCYQKM